MRTWRLMLARIPLVVLATGLLTALVPGPTAYADLLYALSANSNQSETTQVGTVFPEAISVRAVLLSNFSTGVPGLRVVFTAPASGASGTFASTGTNTVTVTSNSLGIATAPTFTANSTVGTYSITISAQDANGNTALPSAVSFTNSANPANLATTISTGNGSNQAAQINHAFAIQMTASVFNGSNQLLPNVPVTFSAPGSGASGTFAGTGTNSTTVNTNATGQATAPVFTANVTSGPYFVTATVDGSQTSSGNPISTTFALTNTTNNPNGVPFLVSVAAGGGQQAPLLTAFQTNMQVAVFDGSQNFVSGATVVFTAPSSGPSGTFPGGALTFTTTSGGQGLAAAPTFASNNSIGSFSVGVTATKSGVTASTGIGFDNGRVMTTTAVTFNPVGHSVFGQPIDVVATVTPDTGSLVPAAPVSFTRGGASVSGCTSVTPSGGVAHCTVTGLTPGTYSFSASYAGDTLSFPSTSAQVTYTVNKADTSVALSTSAPSGTPFGASVTFTATLSVTPPGAGTPTGSVTFTSSDGTLLNGGSSVPLVGNTAQVTTSSLRVGSPVITATYSGDSNFNISSKTMTQTVNKANTSVALSTSAPSGTPFGASVTFTATLSVTAPGAGTPTGSVTFTSSDGTLLNGGAPVPLVGNTAQVTTSSLQLGSPVITATYSGDSNFNGSSTTLTQTVNKANTGVALSSSAPSDTPFGASVTFTATLSVTAPGAGTPTGSVTFTSSDGTLLNGGAPVPLVGNTAQVTTSSLQLGSPVITATYSGDSNFNGSSTTLTQTVNKANTGVALSSSAPSDTPFGASVTFIATLSVTAPGAGTPTGSVTFTSSDGTLLNGGASVPLVGNAAQVTTSSLLVGSPVITATYSGDSNFNSSSATLTQPVVAPTPTPTATSTSTPTPTLTPTPTSTATPTPMLTNTPTPTATSTSTQMPTITPTATITPTPTTTPTLNATNTPTPTAATTPTITPTPTQAPSSAGASTPTTPTPTTPTPTQTPSSAGAPTMTATLLSAGAARTAPSVNTSSASVPAPSTPTPHDTSASGASPPAPARRLPPTPTPTPPPDCGQSGHQEDNAPAGYASDPRGPQGGDHQAYGSSLASESARDAFRASLPPGSNLAAINDAIAHGCSATWLDANLNDLSTSPMP